MFETLQMAPPDSILGLTEAFKKDTNAEKVNLGVGVYKDASGQTPVLASVKKAERTLIETESSKSYLPIDGSPEFATAVQGLLFGADSDVVASSRAVTCQTPGGTGALRVAGDFLRAARPGASLWVSDPTWANHYGVFEASGFEIKTYPYYDANAKALNFQGLIDTLKSVPEGDIVLFHGCCHNPSGMDPDLEQWGEIADVVGQRSLLPLIDFAYQGLANGLNEDCAGMRLFCQPGREALIASSFSKNLGLYNERVGALTLVCASTDVAQAAFSHIKLAIRRNYSNPPSHGGSVVATILGDDDLRAEWIDEVAEIRERIQEMRALFVETLKAKGVTRDFSFITRQNGMFSFSGLTPEQVSTLRDRYSIYIVGNGRINVAGMTRANMDYLCDAIAAVL